MLQIASGLLRGLQLKSPTAEGTRPTSERLRQSLFNVLRNYRWKPDTTEECSILDEAHVADVFAGTGAWGIEALANGAAHCTFIEDGKSALGTLKTNLNTALGALANQNIEKDVELLGLDVNKAYPKMEIVRILFCDPPYHKNWFEKVIDLEAKYNRVEQGGLFLFEAHAKEVCDEKLTAAANLRLFDRKVYGESAVHFMVKEK